MYGKQLIIDLHNCDDSKFNRKDLTQFFIELCALIDMKRCDLHFWDYEDSTQKEYDAEPDHLKGTSACQFISTSNIVIHTLDVLKTVYLDIFTCKDLDVKLAEAFCSNFFSGRIVHSEEVDRI